MVAVKLASVPRVVKVVTWNVNSLKARLPRVLEFLELHAARRRAAAGDQDGGGGLPGRRAAGRRATRCAHHSGRALGGRGDPRPRRRAASQPSSGLPGEVRGDEARWVEATVERHPLRQRLRHQRPRARHRDLRREARLLRGRGAARGAQLRDRDAARSSPATSTSPATTATSTTRWPSPGRRTSRRRSARASRRSSTPAGSSTPTAPARRRPLHVVGLPPGPLPPRPRAAHRLRARQRVARRRPDALLDRARLPQGRQAQRPRAARRRADGLTLAPLPAGRSTTIVVKVTATRAGAVDNRALVAAAGTDVRPANNASRAPVGDRRQGAALAHQARRGQARARRADRALHRRRGRVRGGGAWCAGLRRAAARHGLRGGGRRAVLRRACVLEGAAAPGRPAAHVRGARARRGRRPPVADQPRDGVRVGRRHAPRARLRAHPARARDTGWRCHGLARWRWPGSS